MFRREALKVLLSALAGLGIKLPKHKEEPKLHSFSYDELLQICLGNLYAYCLSKYNNTPFCDFQEKFLQEVERRMGDFQPIDPDEWRRTYFAFVEWERALGRKKIHVPPHLEKALRSMCHDQA